MRSSVNSHRANSFINNSTPALLLLLFLPSIKPAIAQQPVQILILNSYHQSYSWSDDTLRGIQEGLSSVQPRADLHIEYLDLRRHPEPAQLSRMEAFIRDKYAKENISLLIATDDPAVRFIIARRESLFAGIPVVFCGVNDSRASGTYVLNPDLRPWLTGVMETFDINETIATALRFHPATRNIYGIGELEADSFFERDLQNAYPHLKIRAINTQKLTLKELEPKLVEIPPDSLVFIRNFINDRSGLRFPAIEGARFVTRRIHVPAYTVNYDVIGSGVVGGKLNWGYSHGLEAAKMAVRVLQDEKPEMIGVQRRSPNTFHFDFAALRRWRIRESTLPSPHIVVNRPQGFYEKYKSLVWLTAGAMVLQGLIISLLVMSIRRGRKAQRSLALSERDKELALKAGRMGTWKWELATGKVSWSSSHLRLFGYEPDAFAGTFDAVLERVHPDDAETMNEAVKHTLATGDEFRHEYRLCPPSGPQRWMASQGERYLDSRGSLAGITGVTWDITQRKQAEALAASHARELARSNEELERFAYVASHDLQEPLRMIRSYTGLLERSAGSKLDGDAREFMQFIHDGVARMDQLIRDLLEYSRVSHGRVPFSPVPLASPLDAALKLLQASIQENNAVIRSGALPTVHANHAQMVQLFQNLIGNALKYRRLEDCPQIDVNSRAVGDMWQIDVADNGIGVPHDQAERIFGLFKRLHTREVPGTGIGLALCRKIIENHGGQIWVEPAEGDGSVFRCTLPQRVES